MKLRSAITTPELKRLLIELQDKSENTCFRYRIIGEMWNANFHRILGVTETGVALQDEVTNKLIFIRDLATLVQFELDSPFQAYQAHFHYEVFPRISESIISLVE